METLDRIFLKLIMRVPKTDMLAWSLEQTEIPTQILHKSLLWDQLNSFILRLIVECDFFCWIYVHQIFPPRNETRYTSCKGSPSSSCEMIILRNNSQSGISLMKRTHFNELSTKRFFLCTYKISKWTTH